jgi:hypothetical protein
MNTAEDRCTTIAPLLVCGKCGRWDRVEQMDNEIHCACGNFEVVGVGSRWPFVSRDVGPALIDTKENEAMEKICANTACRKPFVPGKREDGTGSNRSNTCSTKCSEAISGRRKTTQKSVAPQPEVKHAPLQGGVSASSVEAGGTGLPSLVSAIVAVEEMCEKTKIHLPVDVRAHMIDDIFKALCSRKEAIA